ncbi:kinase-like protein [Rhizophagus irregularis]|nr:kinase-like protein [Rhizophagus irregularis]
MITDKSGLVRLFGFSLNPEKNKYALVIEYGKYENKLDQYLELNELDWSEKHKIIRNIITLLKNLHENHISLNYFSHENILFRGITSINVKISIFVSFGSEYIINYTAPEILLETGRKNDPSSDIYALGMIFYKIIFEQEPFADTEDESQLINKIINGFCNCINFYLLKSDKHKFIELRTDNYENGINIVNKDQIIDIQMFGDNCINNISSAKMGNVKIIIKKLKNDENKSLLLKEQLNRWYAISKYHHNIVEFLECSLKEKIAIATNIADGILYIHKDLDIIHETLKCWNGDSLDRPKIEDIYERLILIQDNILEMAERGFSGDSPHFFTNEFFIGISLDPSNTLVIEDNRRVEQLNEIENKNERENENKNERENENKNESSEDPSWSEESIALLLTFLVERKREIDQLDNNIKTKFWNDAAIMLSKNGHNGYNAEQCSVKWENIKQNYEDNWYESEVEEILGKNCKDECDLFTAHTKYMYKK